MKNTIKKIVSIAVASALTFAWMPISAVKAAPVEEIPHDNYLVSSGIDSLSDLDYYCNAGNNVEFARGGSNIIKLHLKEHDDTASTGQHVGAFSVFTDHPDWIRVVVCDDGVDVNLPFVVGDDNFPSSTMHSGMSLTVPNHHATFDAWGNQIYEGGAIVFLVANDYAGKGEIDRTVSVSIVSRTSTNTPLFEDCTNIRVNIDAAEPVVEEPVIEEPAVEEPIAEQPADDSNEDKDHGNNGNHNGNVNGNGNNGNNSNANQGNNGNKDKDIDKVEEEVPVPVEEPVPEEEPVVVEEYDEEDDPDSAPLSNLYNGDEIETASATYTVIADDEEGYQVEYSGSIDKKSTSVVIPKSIKVNGIEFAVTSIGDDAFKGNTKLKSVTISSNITEIGENAFWRCKNLKIIKVSSKQLTLSSVGDGAFKKISPSVTIKVPKAKMSSYKRIFKKRGLSKTAKFKAI